MPDVFGARLRQRREERQIDLITIAKQTKIKPSLLEGLERGDVSQWPSGLYRRAFIRAYAQAIDLDPDVLVREFLEAHPEPPQVDVLAAMASTLGAGERYSRSTTTRVRSVVDLAIGSLSKLRRGEPELPSAPPTTAAPPDITPCIEPPSDRQPAARQPLDLQALDRQPSDRPPSDRQPARRVAPPSAPLPAQLAPRNDAPPDRRPATSLRSCEPDLLEVAHLCTKFAVVMNAEDVQPLLQQASALVNARGLIVWLWDAAITELTPALVHGYPPQVVAQLPTLRRDADNATALAFRSAQPCAIAATENVSGALVIPLLTPIGCVGVLAIELRCGTEQTNSIRAVATILAALLAQTVTQAAPADLMPAAVTRT
jgi:transcriptional regulator with XRE-family HTH domain